MTAPTRDQLQRWEERAAIREYLGEQDREGAERDAWRETFPHLPFPTQQGLLFPLNPHHHHDHTPRRQRP